MRQITSLGSDLCVNLMARKGRLAQIEFMGIKTGSLNRLEHEELGSLSNQMLTTILHSAEELVTGGGWLDSINTLLEEVGKATKVSRVWIFQTLDLQDDYILQDYVFEWASEEKYAQIGLPHLNYFRSEIYEPEYISIIDSRKKGEYQHMIVGQLPEGWFKEFLVRQNILSMLTIPIIVDNQWWGTLGLDDCEREFEWSASEITVLRMASYFISSAIVRDNLSARKHQLDLLKENSVCSSWELDIRRGHLWCTSEIMTSYAGTTHNLHFPPRHWLRRIHPEHRKSFFQMARSFLAQPNHPLRYDLRVQKNNGEYCWIEICANNSEESRQQDNVVAGIFWDITKRKKQEQRLIHDASTDPLTGLINRRKMKSLLQEYKAELNISRECFSLAVLDIDHFKNINDSYGHAIGDEVLVHFSNLCLSFLRKGDYIARIGGEEFAILLSETTEEQAFIICQRLCEKVEGALFTSKTHMINYSVSIGVTTTDNSELEISQLFEAADKAMYQAKENGRNRVVSIQT